MKFCCKTMEKSIRDDGPGIVLPLGMNMKTGKQFILGPTYKNSRADRGIMFNYCPWCETELKKKPIYE